MVSCEDLTFTAETVASSASASAAALPTVSSQEGTLRSLKRSQLSRSRSGGIFSNPFRSDREKMDQLSDILNQYSTSGIPEQSGILIMSRAPNDPEDALFLEDHWRYIVRHADDLDKKIQNQQDAIWELLHTEVFYIKRLRVVTDLFLACLCNLQSECLLNDIDTDKMFSNISQVYEANHQFWINYLLPMLNVSRASRQPLNPLLMKEGFSKFDQLFYPYIKYCLEHSNCLQYVKEKHKESELFKTYVVWCETRRECERLRLMDLLVKPMQRLTKYSLLLKAILRKTEMEPDATALKRMNECVEQFVLAVDASLRQKHEEERLAWIASRIESYEAVDCGFGEEVEKVARDYCRLDFLTRPMLGCRSNQIRQLVLEGSNIKLKETPSSSKMDVHCFLFTDILLVCKPLGRKSSDKVRVIRQPFLIDRLIPIELKDSSAFALIYVNELRVASALFTLFSADARTWLDHIKRAQEQFAEARLRANQSPSIHRTADEDDEMYGIPSKALLMAHGSPRSSRSSLIHSHSGSMDMSDAGGYSIMGSSAVLHIPPAPTPNLLGTQTQSSLQQSSRARSFELGDLRNPSLTGHGDWETCRSQSMENRTNVTVMLTSPRPERRAFLLRGSRGTVSASSPYSSCNTLNVPYQQPASHVVQPEPSSNLKGSPPKVPPRTLPPRPPSPVSFQKCTLSASSASINKPPLIKMKNITGLTVHSAPASEGPSPAHSVESDPGSDGTVSTASDMAHKGGPEQTTASFEMDERDPMMDQEDLLKSRLQQKRGDRNNGRSDRTERRYHTADAIESIKKDNRQDSSIQKRFSWNYGQQQPGSGRGGQGGNSRGPVPPYSERILCNKHLNRFLSSESVYSSSGFSSTGSVPLSVGSSECEMCGVEVLGHIAESSPTPSPSPSPSPFGGDAAHHSSSLSSSSQDNAQISRCNSSKVKVVPTPAHRSGCLPQVVLPESSTSHHHLRQGPSGLRRCKTKEDDEETDSLECPRPSFEARRSSSPIGCCSSSTCSTSGPSLGSSSQLQQKHQKIKIDVSEVRDGISSVQITVSGSNSGSGSGGKPTQSELKKMKEFLLTNLESSEV